MEDPRGLLGVLDGFARPAEVWVGAIVLNTFVAAVLAPPRPLTDG